MNAITVDPLLGEPGRLEERCWRSRRRYPEFGLQPAG
jgi:hypothetical protein